MAEKIDEIEIKLSKDKVFAFEESVGELNYKVLKIAKDLGYILPRVDVVFENGVYQLLYGRHFEDGTTYCKNYGGHTRSRLAYDFYDVLECNLWNYHVAEPKVSWIPIQDVELVAPRREGMIRLKENLLYLPKNMQLKFMEDNDLVFHEYYDNYGYSHKDLWLREDFELSRNLPF